MAVKMGKFHPVFLLTSGAVLFLVFAGSALVGYFQGGFPSGADASSHFFLGLIYSREIWPAIHGWTDQWFQGFSFPQFYPPLLYWMMGLINQMVPTTPNLFWEVLVFKLIQVLSLAAIPGIVGLIVSLLTQRFYLIVLGQLLSAVCLSAFTIDQSLSLGLTGVLQVGLSSQVFGAVASLALIYQILHHGLSQCLSLWTAVLTAGVLLSNIHCALFVGMFLGVYQFSSMWTPSRLSRETMISILVGFSLSAPWYAAVLILSHESPGLILAPREVYQSLVYLWPILGIFLIVGCVSFRIQKESWKGLFLATLVCMSLTLLPFHRWNLSLPWQPVRIYSMGFLLLPVLFAGSFDGLARYFARPKLVAGLALLLSLFIVTEYRAPAPGRSVVSGEFMKATLELRAWLTQNPSKGYVLVGVPEDNSFQSMSDFFTLNAAATSIPGNRGLWTVFRESSLNSIYLVPLRNALSLGNEEFGVAQFLDSNGDFKRKSWDERVKLVREFGVARVIYAQADAVKIERLKLPLRKVYGNDRFVVFDFEEAGDQSRSYSRVKFVVGPYQSRERGKYERGIPWVSEELLRRGLGFAPIVASRTCKPVRNLEREIGRTVEVTCLTPMGCCTRYANSIEEILDPKVGWTSIWVTLFNESPRTTRGLFGLPHRRVEFTPQEPESIAHHAGAW